MANLIDFYKKISEETGVSKVLVEIIATHQYSYLKKQMQNPELPGVLLHGLGTFRARRGRIDFLIKKLIWRIRKKSGNELELKEKIRYLWAVRRNTYK
tara:strand:+ start:146 stop:439 length:294 start_codon:yes stop_codon:yes gene_type:complete